MNDTSAQRSEQPTLDTETRSLASAAVKVLSGLGTVHAAYLFGSHVEGKPDQWSDIDLAVFVEGLENWDIRRRATAMAMVTEQVATNVEAHLFPVSALQKPTPGGLAQYIIEHGLKLPQQN